MLDLVVLEKYRLKSDGTQYVIYEQKLVDPTKAPGYAPKEGRDDSARLEWVSIGKYASTLTRGLQIIREIELHNSDCTSLVEVQELIADLDRKFDDALSGN